MSDSHLGFQPSPPAEMWSAVPSHPSQVPLGDDFKPFPTPHENPWDVPAIPELRDGFMPSMFSDMTRSHRRTDSAATTASSSSMASTASYQSTASYGSAASSDSYTSTGTTASYDTIFESMNARPRYRPITTAPSFTSIPTTSSYLPNAAAAGYMSAPLTPISPITPMTPTYQTMVTTAGFQPTTKTASLGPIPEATEPFHPAVMTASFPQPITPVGYAPALAPSSSSPVAAHGSARPVKGSGKNTAAAQISAESIAFLDCNASKVNTGVSTDDVSQYLRGPDEEHPKTWWCLFPGCSKKFGRKENARSHVQTHLGDRKYKCPVCSSQFVRSNDLKRHAKIHTGVKPYYCECSKEFNREDALTRHRARGMCCGAFPDAKPKAAKRGRPRKHRPDTEERVDKAKRTRANVKKKAEEAEEVVAAVATQEVLTLPQGLPTPRPSSPEPQSLEYQATPELPMLEYSDPTMPPQEAGSPEVVVSSSEVSTPGLRHPDLEAPMISAQDQFSQVEAVWISDYTRLTYDGSDLTMFPTDTTGLLDDLPCDNPFISDHF